MLQLTQMFVFLFGVLTIVGGVIGFTKAGSRASLIAGGISGLLLLIAGALMGSPAHQHGGIILALVISVLLLGRFLPIFLKKKSWMPAGMMSVLGIVAVVLTAVLLNEGV